VEVSGMKFFLSLFVVFLSLSFVSAYNVSQQQDVCDILNMSFTDCYEFWDVIENPINQTICNFSNYTLTSECSNFTQSDCNCSLNSVDDELRKIDEYQKRGFEPVFDDLGLIFTWKKSSSECPSTDGLISQDDCDVLVSEAVVQSRNSGSSPSSSDDYFGLSPSIFWAIFVFIVAGGFIIYKKYKKFVVSKLNSNVGGVDFPENGSTIEETRF
jgi:hypothetical protein